MVTTTKSKQYKVSVNFIDERDDAFEDMYQLLLEAPLPLDQNSLYAHWYRLARQVIRVATKVREIK